MSVITDYLTKTTKVLHVYADGTSGNDANTGKSGSPVKTITKALELIPDVISHDTVLHLSGTFDLVAELGSGTFLYVDKVIEGGLFLIDGGDAVIQAAVGSTGITITGSDVDYVTATGAGWTVDQWKGYWIKVPSGEIRTIQRNTADTIYPCQYFSAAPTGTLDIVRSATTITASSPKIFYLQCKSDWCILQRLHFAASSRLYAKTLNNVTLSGITLTNTSIATLMIIGVGGAITFSSFCYDPANPSSTLADLRLSVAAIAGTIDHSGTGTCVFHGTIAKHLVLNGVFLYNFYYGCNFGDVRLINTTKELTRAIGYPYGSDQIIRIGGGSGVGLSLENCVGVVSIYANRLDISNCASHGIEVNNSQLQFDGGISGSGNGGAGVYAHNGATVTTKAGTAPTLTGTIGDLAVTNPAIADATWAQITGGDTLASAVERTLVKAE